jgi:cell fate regulator YaaT (PSP1 superfamily)
MPNLIVELYKWENPRFYSGEGSFEEGEKVIVEGEFGNDLGVIKEVILEYKEAFKQSILRKATQRDIEFFEKNKEKKNEILEMAKKEIRRLALEMKLIDVCITLDGSNIIVVFTADGRVDFRELVKNLSKIFHRSVRMQQIGSRDEARKLGGCGICGRELCCVKFSGNLPSISTEMARIQQIAHRGSERISGVCGRLMCCLAYEAEQYKEMMAGMPELHSFVKTKAGKGEVVDINPMSGEIKVKLENKETVTVKKEDLG